MPSAKAENTMWDPNHVTSCDITATSSIPWHVITWRPQCARSAASTVGLPWNVHFQRPDCAREAANLLCKLLRFWKLSGLRCLRGAIIIVRETFESRRNISLLRMEMDENWWKRMESACKNWIEYPSPSVSRGTETCKTHFHPKHSKPCETELLFASYQWNFSRFKHNPEILLKFVQNRSDWIKQNKASFKFRNLSTEVDTRRQLYFWNHLVTVKCAPHAFALVPKQKHGAQFMLHSNIVGHSDAHMMCWPNTPVFLSQPLSS